MRSSVLSVSRLAGIFVILEKSTLFANNATFDVVALNALVAETAKFAVLDVSELNALVAVPAVVAKFAVLANGALNTVNTVPVRSNPTPALYVVSVSTSTVGIHAVPFHLYISLIVGTALAIDRPLNCSTTILFDVPLTSPEKTVVSVRSFVLSSSKLTGLLLTLV